MYYSALLNLPSLIYLFFFSQCITIVFVKCLLELILSHYWPDTSTSHKHRNCFLHLILYCISLFLLRNAPSPKERDSMTQRSLLIYTISFLVFISVMFPLDSYFSYYIQQDLFKIVKYLKNIDKKAVYIRCQHIAPFNSSAPTKVD